MPGSPVSDVTSAPITEALITQVVHTFYGRVRQHAVLGPIFERKLAGRWEAHLATMVDFWSSVLLRTGRYQGKLQAAHHKLGLEHAHFQQWLVLFEATVGELCTRDVAQAFMDRAHRIADSLQIGLKIGPKALVLPPRVAGPAID